MHGNRSQVQRERALASFESAKVSTLVATDVAARGIDVDRISHVINFDPPEDRDAYVHRVGRTGRAGRDGIGITFHSAAERGKIAGLADELGIEHRVAAGARADVRPARTEGRRAGTPRRGRGKPTSANAGSVAPTGGRTRSYGRQRGR
jgi:superfamily II DNA/RNA helicase